MKLVMFTIPALHPAEHLIEFNQFCAAHKTTSIEKQFVADGANSYDGTLTVSGDSHVSGVACH